MPTVSQRRNDTGAHRCFPPFVALLFRCACFFLTTFPVENRQISSPSLYSLRIGFCILFFFCGPTSLFSSCAFFWPSGWRTRPVVDTNENPPAYGSTTAPATRTLLPTQDVLCRHAWQAEEPAQSRRTPASRRIPRTKYRGRPVFSFHGRFSWAELTDGGHSCLGAEADVENKATLSIHPPRAGDV